MRRCVDVGGGFRPTCMCAITLDFIPEMSSLTYDTPCVEILMMLPIVLMALAFSN